MPRNHQPDPGEYDRLVTIEQATQGTDDASFPVDTWSALADAYMAVTPLSGRERFQQGQMSAAADTRFEMGYSSDMDPETNDVTKTRRLSYQGRYYDIIWAAMIGRRAGIELIALSRVG